MLLETKDVITIAGFIIAFVGGRLTSRAQSRQDFRKWLRARQDDVRKDVRFAVADIAEQLAAFAHSMMHVTYNLNRGMDVKQNTDAYEKESHEFISRLSGSKMRLAALDFKTYQKVAPLISKAINLSEEVHHVISVFEKDSVTGREAILSCNREALSFIKALPKQVGDSIGLESLFSESEAGLATH